MTRLRLRPAHPPDELAQIYAAPHQHNAWDEHRLRVDVTIALARWHVRDVDLLTAADLSCGDGAVIDGVLIGRPRIAPGRVWLGDYAPGYPTTGPIEQTVKQIPHVDLFVCCETIEHLDDPDSVLTQIGDKADRLILSTPAGENDDDNEEHYWGWDVVDVREMLVAAGWTPVSLIELKLRPEGHYDYQIWACVREGEGNGSQTL